MNARKLPNEPEYWDRSAETIAKELPGERVLTENGRLVIVTRVEAFRGLIRGAMSNDFESVRRRKPGSVYMTSIRGFPLLNVTARMDGDETEVVWLKEMFEEGEKVTASNIISSMAKDDAGVRKMQPKKVLEYASKKLNGEVVTDAKSPMKIIQNLDLPFDERKISFNARGGSAENSVGVASLIDPVNGIDSLQQAQLIMKAEAERLGVTLEELLEPARVAQNLKKSPLLRKVMRFFASEE